MSLKSPLGAVDVCPPGGAMVDCSTICLSETQEVCIAKDLFV